MQLVLGRMQAAGGLRDFPGGLREPAAGLGRATQPRRCVASGRRLAYY